MFENTRLYHAYRRQRQMCIRDRCSSITLEKNPVKVVPGTEKTERRKILVRAHGS